MSLGERRDRFTARRPESRGAAAIARTSSASAARSTRRCVMPVDAARLKASLTQPFANFSVTERSGADQLTMTINSINASAIGASQATGSLQHHRAGKAPSLDNTAELLGVSASDLGAQLKSGRTLNDIASAQGVSSDDLMSALKTDLKTNKPAGAPELSDDQLTQMATNIASGKRPGGANGGGPPKLANGDGTTAEMNLQSLAKSLGLSQDDLLTQLTSGTSFGALLGSAGSSPYGSGSKVSGGILVDEYA